jgi:LPS sulfotransferase NodH
MLDQRAFTGDPTKIFICSTPRSGSYMLCRYMINAGLGIPHEYFNPVIMREIAPRLGFASEVEGLKWRSPGRRDRLPFGKAPRAAEIRFLEEYIHTLIPRRCQNGIFAAKIHFDQYIRVLNNRIGRKLLDGGLFIYLFREDLLQQTVSRNFAYMTGQWGIDDTVTTAPAAHSNLLDVKSIDRELNTLADEDRGWRVFLAKNGLSPISLSYEQLCKDPNLILAAIAARVGINPQTLSYTYSEPASQINQDRPRLPKKGEVIDQYLNAVRQIRGFKQESRLVEPGMAAAK